MSLFLLIPNLITAHFKQVEMEGATTERKVKKHLRLGSVVSLVTSDIITTDSSQAQPVRVEIRDAEQISCD